MWRTTVAIAALLNMGAGASRAAPAGRDTTSPLIAAYSNVCIAGESGDLVGEYILIMKVHSYEPQMFAIVKEGAEAPPDVMGVQIDGEKINIYMLNDSPEETSYFRGRITAQEISGHIKNYPQVEHLLRIPNKMRLYADCKPGK